MRQKQQNTQLQTRRNKQNFQQYKKEILAIESTQKTEVTGVIEASAIQEKIILKKIVNHNLRFRKQSEVIWIVKCLFPDHHLSLKFKSQNTSLNRLSLGLHQ